MQVNLWAQGETFFKVLASRERLQMVAALAGGPLCISQLRDRTRLDLSTVSRHVGKLARAGLVELRPCGREKSASLARPELLGWLREAGLPIPAAPNALRCECGEP